MKTWFSIKAQAAGQPTEVSIYDDIGGWGVTFASFAEAIKAVQGPIVLRINSYGGDVFAGLAMHNLLKQRGNVDTVIEGVAASAATLPFLAGRKRSMPRGSYFMVHNPWSGVLGGAADMRQAADLLERIGGTLADLYAAATGIDKAEVQRLMDAETWLDGAGAVEGGWATDLIDGEPVLASVRPGQFRNAPRPIRAASPDALMVGDYVALTFNGGETKGEVVEVLTTGTASGNDGSVDATAQDPAALVEVYRETATPGVFEESDVIVARLFSALTRVEEPTMAEDANQISAPMSGANKQTMTAQLLALLGIKPTAREDFLASAITALGVTPEAVSAALDSGKSGFVADHIKAAIDVVKAEADKLRPEASLLADVRAALGVPATADKAAILAAVEAKASAQAADILAQRGVPSAKTSGLPSGSSAPNANLSGLALAMHANRIKHASRSNN